ncbi:MAG: hypothetical protein H7843_14465 [Nitrospirota bacterium]
MSGENNSRQMPERQPQVTGPIKQKDKDFVKASNGTYDFGMLDKHVAEAIGGKEAPIRLQAGNEKYGEHHLNIADDGKRFDAIRAAGYETVKDFIEAISKNWNEIREGTGTSKLLIKADAKDSVAAIELKSDDNGTYYSVITGGVFRKNYGRNKKLLRKRGAPSLDRPELSTPIPYDTSGNAQEGITERTGTRSHSSTIPEPQNGVKEEE